MTRADREPLHRRGWIVRVAAIPPIGAQVPDRRANMRSHPVLERGGIVRGPRDRKCLTLVFTGDYHAAGAVPILGALRRRDIASAWFLTGRFHRTPEFRAVTRRAFEQGHDLGPRGDEHLLHASRDRPPKLLVSRDRYLADLRANEAALDAFVRGSARYPYFLPPYEHYTAEIVRWAASTRSNVDDLEDDDPRLVAADEIVASVLRAERATRTGSTATFC
jgi:peptidoglycan/xylan/chitin deacetylase (PgdA/CDA1 family)